MKDKRALLATLNQKGQRADEVLGALAEHQVLLTWMIAEIEAGRQVTPRRIGEWSQARRSTLQAEFHRLKASADAMTGTAEPVQKFRLELEEADPGTTPGGLPS